MRRSFIFIPSLFFTRSLSWSVPLKWFSLTLLIKSVWASRSNNPSSFVCTWMPCYAHTNTHQSECQPLFHVWTVSRSVYTSAKRASVALIPAVWPILLVLVDPYWQPFGLLRKLNQGRTHSLREITLIGWSAKWISVGEEEWKKKGQASRLLIGWCFLSAHGGKVVTNVASS